MRELRLCRWGQSWGLNSAPRVATNSCGVCWGEWGSDQLRTIHAWWARDHVGEGGGGLCLEPGGELSESSLPSIQACADISAGSGDWMGAGTMPFLVRVLPLQQDRPDAQGSQQELSIRSKLLLSPLRWGFLLPYPAPQLCPLESLPETPGSSFSFKVQGGVEPGRGWAWCLCQAVCESLTPVGALCIPRPGPLQGGVRNGPVGPGVWFLVRHRRDVPVPPQGPSGSVLWRPP